MSLTVKIVVRGGFIPEYQTSGSAGMDLASASDEPIVLESGEQALIPTGIYIELPIGYEAQIRPRSSIATKHGIIIPNAPGTIDSDYRGEIKVCLRNTGNLPYCIDKGDRIAQMIVAKYEKVEWLNTEELTESDRQGGFGSTGLN